MNAEEPITLAEIAESIDDFEAEARRRAAARLSDLEPADALPLLRKVLGDADWRVRKEAAKAARTFADQPPLIAALVDTLRGTDPTSRENVGLRNSAVEVLAQCGDSAVRAVSAALRDLDADGRKLAIEVLGRSQSHKALPALTAALGDADINVREATVEAIASLGPVAPDAVRDVLLAALEDDDLVVQLAALEGLNGLGVAIPWKRLAEMLRTPTLRSAALSAATLVDQPEAAARAIVEAIEGSSRGTVEHALAALARMADGAGRDAVAKALADKPGVAGAALDIARGERGEIGDLRTAALRVAGLGQADGAVDVAVCALADEAVADHAHAVLSWMGVRALPRVIEILAVSRRGAVLGREAPDTPLPSIDARVTLIELLTSSIDPEAADGRLVERAIMELRREARSDNARVANAALLGLSRLGDASDLALVAELASADTGTLSNAAELALASLARRHPVAARELCREAMGSDSNGLAATILIGALADVETTADAAGRPPAPLDAEAARSFLGSAITADDPRTRAAAASAIALLGGPATGEVLTFALADEERRVQLSAARALGRLWSSVGSEVLEIVERTDDPELIAAVIRSLGDSIADRRPPDGGRGVARALRPFVKRSDVVVAVAAVDALHHAVLAGSDAAGLIDAIAHPDPDVVRGALLKLESIPGGRSDVARCLDHPSPEVRLMATEMLAVAPPETAREPLSQRAQVETDREVRFAIDSALAELRRRDPEPDSG